MGGGLWEVRGSLPRGYAHLAADHLAPDVGKLNIAEITVPDSDPDKPAS